jgi:hypothetical protein
MERKPWLNGLSEKVGLSAVHIAATIIAYILFSQAVYRPHLPGGTFILTYAVVASLALGGITLSYSLATPAYRILTRSVIAFALFYVVTSHIPIAEAVIAGDRLADFELNLLWVIAAACGLIGFFRPSFGLVPLLYIPWQKHQLAHVMGMPIDWMDHFTLIETGSYLILGYLVFGAFARAWPAIAPTPDGGRTDHAGLRQSVQPSLHPVDVLVLTAIALHFGNYFYAGLIKAILGDSPLYWILHNPTELLVLAAWDNSVLPISFDNRLPAFTYELLSNVRVFTNLFTIGAQLLAVVAILRIRSAIWITVFYDILHSIIFVTTGIFFWKFIILNLAIVASLSRMGIPSFPRRLKMALASIVVCSPYIFHIMPSFAWLDTRSVNEVHLYAVAEDGKEYRVPSNYFLGASITLAQNRLVWPADESFPTQTWGTTRDSAVARRGLACDWPQGPGRWHVPFQVPKWAIEKFVRLNHLQILSMTDDNGFVDYDLFPHHIFSTPWGFEDFKKLDKRLIRSYRYESEAVCLGYKDGTVTRKRMHYSTFDIPL